MSDLRALEDSVQAVADALSNEPKEVKSQSSQNMKQPEKKQITLEVKAVLAESMTDLQLK